MEAMESLKKMIRSWLDDTFPSMPEEKRISLSEAMDVTLLEQQKVRRLSQCLSARLSSTSLTSFTPLRLRA